MVAQNLEVQFDNDDATQITISLLRSREDDGGNLHTQNIKTFYLSDDNICVHTFHPPHIIEPIHNLFVYNLALTS